MTIPAWLLSVSTTTVLFLIYAIVGWIIDVFGAYAKSKTIENRGILFGTLCPIYAFGALSSVLIFEKLPSLSNLFIIFAVGVLVSGLIEYSTHWFLEKVYHIQLWNYDDHRFNFQGRVCLSNALAFGLAIVMVVRWINPWLVVLLDKQPPLFLVILAILTLIYFIIDVTITFIMLGQVRPVLIGYPDIIEDIKRLRRRVDKLVVDKSEDVVDAASETVDDVQKKLSYMKRVIIQRLADSSPTARIVKQKLKK